MNYVYGLGDIVVVRLEFTDAERHGVVVAEKPEGWALVKLWASKGYPRESEISIGPEGTSTLGTFTVVRHVTKAEYEASGSPPYGGGMGYSESRKTLERIRPQMADLEKGVGTRWNLAPGVSARDFAYSIREGLHIATLYSGEYPDLAKAHSVFRIEMVDRSTVQAVFKGRRAGDQVISTVTVGVESSERGPTTLTGPQDATTVIGAWHKTQPSSAPMHFTQANLSREELLKLYAWAEKRTPKWLMLVADNGSLTIQPYSDEMDGLGWDPTDE